MKWNKKLFGFPRSFAWLRNGGLDRLTQTCCSSVAEVVRKKLLGTFLPYLLCTRVEIQESFGKATIPRKRSELRRGSHTMENALWALEECMHTSHVSSYISAVHASIIRVLPVNFSRTFSGLFSRLRRNRVICL